MTGRENGKNTVGSCNKKRTQLEGEVVRIRVEKLETSQDLAFSTRKENSIILP